MRDGKIVTDQPVTDRLMADTELQRIDREHQAIRLQP
jgi:hypothetical protein